VEGSVDTPAGPAARVTSALRFADRLGAWKARWGIGRMHYTVDPGLYALNQPGPGSPVFVTANYRMSFDRLRAALTGIDGWILVLDTKGINVWCAAGKGTFGTDELIRRIDGSGLPMVVSHRELILPQLGAPGVAAHEVRDRSGFRVIYGPVAAGDLPAFMVQGLKATAAMRSITFTFTERLALVPVELVGALKIALPVAAALFVLSFSLSAFSLFRSMEPALVAALAIGVSILSGAVFAPLLLPWLPGRAFSGKGLITGLAAVALLILVGNPRLSGMWMLMLVLAIPSMSAFLAMNFTGASTFTSLSGVRKEMRWALPVEIAGTAAALLVWIAVVALGGS
jgi:hypothetical protein